MAGSTQQLTPQQVNQLARQAIKAKAVKMSQNIYSQTWSSNFPTNVTVQPRYAGLGKGFWVKVSATVNNGSAVTINLTDFGPANLLSMIQLNDLQNNIRIQSPGWLMHFVNTAKARRPFGTSFVKATGIDTPINYGNNDTNQISAPATIAAAGNGTVIMWYWIPMAYSEDDLRGAIYLNVVNATMQLQLSLPGTNGVSLAVANGADSTQSVFVGAAAGSVALVALTALTITVQQEYWDQIPSLPGYGLLLPVTDLGTIYEIKSTTLSGMVSGSDFPYQYPNYRDVIGTYPVYVNNGTTGARGVGADTNYWQLLSANATALWKKTPDLISVQNRNFMGADLPPGVNYFDSRQRPISTTQYGNMQLVLNPITATASPYMLVGLEDFALVQTLSVAGSLNAGA